MDRAASPFADDDDGLYLPPGSKARTGGTEKKETPVPRLSQRFRQSGKQSLTSYHTPRLASVRDVDVPYQAIQSHFCQSSVRHPLPKLFGASERWPYFFICRQCVK